MNSRNCKAILLMDISALQSWPTKISKFANILIFAANKSTFPAVLSTPSGVAHYPFSRDDYFSYRNKQCIL